MTKPRKLVIIGFDSISQSVLETFVQRGALPTVGRLIREGAITQTWPCFPMETGTNWASLATGASPSVTGCNMHVHLAGTPLDQRAYGFPGEICQAEQLWTTAARAGKRAVVFDWSQSLPMKQTEGIIHVGEDGRPDNAIGALQEVRAYTTHPRQPGPHVTKITPEPLDDWLGAPEGALAFEMTIEPGPYSRFGQVDSLYALILIGESGYDRVSVYAQYGASKPLLTVSLGQWSEWQEHTFTADGQPVGAGLRAKLLRLSPDASDVHLYLSEIYAVSDVAYPREIATELRETVGMFVNQPSRQQVVQGGASDIATYFEEQHGLAEYWRQAAKQILSNHEWDLFMLKWHGPDWTNHLTMYMIDPRHPMYDPERADEGWALWDRLMSWGDEIIATVLEIAGPDTLVALVSDHGGGTELPGLGVPRNLLNDVLEQHGWLIKDAQGQFDGARSRAYGYGHYVYLNVKGRDPNGIVEPGDEYQSLREEIIEALLGAKAPNGQHAYRAVLTKEVAGRLGVGGDRVGDIFCLGASVHPLAEIDKEQFWRTHSIEETGTWDWPRLNTGDHLDDSYFVFSGPGIKAGYRRSMPTLITSVAPTCATAWGIPVPADANGSILLDFMASTS